MKADRILRIGCGLAIVLVCAFLAAAAPAPDVSGIPGPVMKTLQGRFPGAQITKWTREEEAGETVYDIEFKRSGKKMEADIAGDGSIRNWEREIRASELPPPVRRTLESQYKGASVRETMAISAVKDGKDVPEGYEILLRKGKESFEITVSPEGKVLESPQK